MHIDLDELLAVARYQEGKLKRYIKKVEEQLRQLQLQQALEEEKPKVLH